MAGDSPHPLPDPGCVCGGGGGRGDFRNSPKWLPPNPSSESNRFGTENDHFGSIVVRAPSRGARMATYVVYTARMRPTRCTPHKRNLCGVHRANATRSPIRVVSAAQTPHICNVCSVHRTNATRCSICVVSTAQTPKKCNLCGVHRPNATRSSICVASTAQT